MHYSLWIGLFGTLVAAFFLANSIRNLRRSSTGHAANAGRLHIAMVVVFLPVMWLTILLSL